MMPLIRVQTSASLDASRDERLKKSLSVEVAKALGKPESYMMVVLEPDRSMLMGGASGPAAFVEVRSVGAISADQAKGLSALVCRTLSESLAVPSERIYLNCQGVPGEMWGHDGGTFG
jgi:phenylpyruvate tautomerase PptA (4-oxalocrotonate tautomerase family)